MRARITDAKRLFAKVQRARLTDAETKLWSILRSRRLASFKFRRQVPIGSWIVDFVCFSHKLIIEADGSQHADSVRDTGRDADLTQRGFRILRFWNNDVLLNSTAVAEAIYATLMSIPSPGGLRPPPSPTRGEGIQRTP